MAYIEYGGYIIPVRSVQFQKQRQEPEARGTGTTARSNRQGTRQHLIEDLSGGLCVHRGRVADHSTRYQDSQGLMAHQFGELTLPPVITAQSTLQSVDASAYFSSNKPAVWASSSVGSSTGPVTYVAQGPYLFRMNQSTGALTLADTRTDDITAMGDVVANSTAYFAIATDGTTDDCKVTTDPTAGTISWSEWITLASGDRIDWFQSLPEIGPNGTTLLMGKLGSNQGAFYLEQDEALTTAPLVVVETGTKNQTNTANPTEDSGFVNPSDIILESGSSLLDATNNESKIAADDGTEMHIDLPGTVVIDYLFDFSSSLPAGGADVVGFTHRTERRVPASVGDECYTDNLQLITYSAGSKVVYSINKADGDSASSTGAWAEQAAPGEDHDDGSATDRWGTDPDLDTVRASNFGATITIVLVDDSEAAEDAYVDHVALKVHYRKRGYQQKINLGSRLIGEDPLTSGRIWFIRGPDMDTSREKERKLTFMDYEWDPTGERLTATYTNQLLGGFEYVQSGAFCVDDDCLFILAANGPDSSTTLLRIPLSTRVTEDLNWSREQGYLNAWNMINLYPLGEDVIIQCTDGTNIKDMIYSRYHDSFHWYGPQVNTAGLYMTWYGPGPIDPISRYRVGLYAVSNTHLAAFRQYTPESSQLDIPTYLSSVTKEDGPLTITLPDLDLFGPEESDKMLIKATCFGSDISASSTVRLRYDADNTGSFTTWATFTASGQSSTLSTPVAFKTVTLEIALDHTASSTDTPNALPILIEGVALWPEQRSWIVDVDTTDSYFQAQFPEGIEDMFEHLIALDPVNTLKVGITEKNATWDLEPSVFEPADQPIARPKPIQTSTIIRFNEVVS